MYPFQEDAKTWMMAAFVADTKSLNVKDKTNYKGIELQQATNIISISLKYQQKPKKKKMWKKNCLFLLEFLSIMV